MPHASVIHICAYCPEQHIISVDGDPSAELVDRVKAEYLPARKVSPGLDQALQVEECILSHGLCEKAAQIASDKIAPLPDSGISTGGIKARLVFKAYLNQGTTDREKGAFDFHQLVENLIGQGSDRAQVRTMLERMRDSYPQGDHRRDIAQAEIDWVAKLPPDALATTPEPQSLN